MSYYKENLLLVFEGADGSGKDTLIDTLKLMSQFKDVRMENRGTISERVYALKFKRELIDGVPLNIHSSYWEYYIKAHYDVRIILCNPVSEVLATRCIAKREDFARNRDYQELVDYLEKDRSMFEFTTKNVASTYKFKVLDLDTDNSLDLCINDIEEFIEDAKI